MPDRQTRLRRRANGQCGRCGRCVLTQNSCVCKRRWGKTRRQRAAPMIAAFIASYKMARGCADCGYKQHPAALEFDHLPGLGKLRCVSQLRSLSAVKREIKRCEVVCANCHVIRTVNRIRQAKV